MNDKEITDEDLSGPVINRRTTLKLFSAGAAASLAGCTGGEQQTTPGSSNQGGNSSKKSGGKLSAGWNLAEIPNLDPVLNSTVGFEQASMNIFNGLLRTNPKLEIHGEAAKDWTLNNGTQYVFTLREGMKFQKGYGEVTAKDVKYSLKRGLTASGSQVKQNLSPLKPIEKGGVVVRDKYTVEINLKHRFAPFLKYLTRSGGACQIMPKEAVEKLGRKYKVKPIGSGPFEVARHSIGSSLVLKSFDNYWNKDKQGTPLPYLDQVTIEPIPSPSTLINALRSGDVKFMNKVPFQKVNTVKSSSGVKIHQGTAGGWEGLYFNLAKEPWKSNQKLRRGIAKVLDKKQYVKSAFLGNQMAGIGPISPIHDEFWRPKDKKPSYQKTDRKTGKQLIKESGKMGTEMNIMVWKAAVRRGRSLSQQLSEYFDTKVDAYDYSTYLDRLYPKSGSQYYDVTPWGSDTDVALDTSLYSFFKSPNEGGVFNRMGYSNKKVDQWLEKERRTTDTEKRAKIFHKIEDQIMQDVPVAFTHHYYPWQAVSKTLKGFTFHPIRRDFTRVWLSD
jgi:peptide/nickel transport system substrate-binding protein